MAMNSPSGHNLQPWHFVIQNSTEKVYLYVDKSRTPPECAPLDSNYVFSRTAIGCTIGNPTILLEDQLFRISKPSGFCSRKKTYHLFCKENTSEEFRKWQLINRGRVSITLTTFT
jgi:hypothetical protein